MADTVDRTVDETADKPVDKPANRPIKLTQTVKKGGCAAKIAAGTLSELLQTLPRQSHPDLLVGTDFLDDAAVWRVNDEQVMVQTLDFFTPILDDAFDFGAVAAANALSDVFAMGAAPVTALTILAYPLDTLPPDILRELMAGAVAKVNEAGARLVGGHSIDDDTLKLGFSVTGLAHPDQLWSNRGVREGDVLILTKAVGTGTLTGALKNGELNYDDIAEAISSMKTLNNLALPNAFAQRRSRRDRCYGLRHLGARAALGAGVSSDARAKRAGRPFVRTRRRHLSQKHLDQSALEQYQLRAGPYCRT